MTRNRTPTPVYLDPGMHSGLEVKGLTTRNRPTSMSSGKIPSRICEISESVFLDIILDQFFSS